MSLPTRPNMDEYIQFVDQLADKKAEYSRKEYLFAKTTAHNIKKAKLSGAKTRDIDFVKVIGNNTKEEEFLDALKEEMVELQREITVLYGKMEAWKSNRDLYRSDSYHQVTGSSGLSYEEE